MTLKDFFVETPKAALGFSGGVDSAYLLYAALECGAQVRPYYVKTAFQPQFELDDARRLAKQLGIDLTVLEHDILSCSVITANSPDRCYHCKSAIFGILREQAARDGFSVLLDGSNASDNAAERPGTQALRELSVRSPLRECGLTKDEIRTRSKEAGLFTWNKPAYACLATRIPVNREITDGLLRRVEAAEDELFALGFSDLRVRICGDGARLELPKAQMARVLEQKDEITSRLAPFFETIALDLKGR